MDLHFLENLVVKGGLAKRSHILVSAESEVDGIDGVVGHVDDP